MAENKGLGLPVGNAELIVDKYMPKYPNFLQAIVYRSQAVASKRLGHWHTREISW